MKTKILTCLGLASLLAGAVLIHPRHATAPVAKPLPKPGLVVSNTSPASPAPTAVTTPKKSNVSQPATPSPTFIPAKQTSGQTVVRSRDPSAVISYAAAHHIAATQTSPQLVLLQAAPNSPVIAALTAALPGLNTSADFRYQPAVTATDPYFSSQWNLTKIQVPAAWDYSTGSSSVTLAVIDSGVLSSQTINGTTYTQADLPSSRIKLNAGEQGATQSGDHCWTGTPRDKSSNGCDDDQNGYVDDWRGWDFMGGYRGTSAACPNHADGTTYQYSGDANYLQQDNDPQPYSCDNPNNTSILNRADYSGSCGTYVGACTVGHGTEVASVAAAEANNGNYIAGVDQHAKIMNLRIFDGYGYTDSARIAAAVDYATASGANVINLSLAFSSCDGSFTDSTIETSLAAAKTAGVTIVAASGNTNSAFVCYPASSSNVIAVGATESNDHRASFSSYGSALSTTAPGEAVPAANAPTAYLNANLISASGTSFSSPTVAGVATLIKAVKPLATPDEIKALIGLRSDIVDDMQLLPHTAAFGYGRVNAYTSVRTASGQLPVYKLGYANIGDHIYTTDITERNELLQAYKLIYTEIGYWSTDGSPVASAMTSRAQ